MWSSAGKPLPRNLFGGLCSALLWMGTEPWHRRTEDAASSAMARHDARIASSALQYPAPNVSGSKPPSEIDSGRRRVAPSAADRARTIAVVLRPAPTWMADSSVCMLPQDCCRHHCSGTRGAPLQRQAQLADDLVLSQKSWIRRCGVRYRRPDGESLTANHHIRQAPDLPTGDRSELERLCAPSQGLAGLGSPGPDRAGQCRWSQ